MTVLNEKNRMPMPSAAADALKSGARAKLKSETRETKPPKKKVPQRDGLAKYAREVNARLR